MENRIENIVVLGGGSAGWMSAAYLAKTFQSQIQVTVLEAPSIPRIGVGESTVPSLQNVFFDKLGLDEDDWMRECNGSFKTGMRFINWKTAGKGTLTPREHNGRTDDFYMIFGHVPNIDGIPISHYWFHKNMLGAAQQPYAYACLKEAPCVAAKLGPRTAEGRKASPYAWHLDAQMLADFLCRFSVDTLGVRHVRDKMVGAERDENGFVTSLITEGGQTLKGDMFLDCSGFRGLLIQNVMGEPIISARDYLMVDRAVATPVPYEAAKEGVEPTTFGIAMESGWCWKAPMLNRFGAGYVYCSEFVSDDEAMSEFCSMWNLDPNTTKINKLKFQAQKTRKSWVKNVVAVGLASSWTEPMHATGIYQIYYSLYRLVTEFPDKNFDQVYLDRYNRDMDKSFNDLRDILQMHYYLSPRADTPFWRANKELPISDEMREKLDMHRAGIPINPPPVDDVQSYYRSFDYELLYLWPNHFYSSLFAGLDFFPEHLAALSYAGASSFEKAEAYFEDIRRGQVELLGSLPPTYDILTKIHQGHRNIAS